MRVRYHIVMMCGLLLSLLACKTSDIAKEEIPLQKGIIHYYTQFCFDNGLCTEFKYERIAMHHTRDTANLEIDQYTTERVPIIDLAVASDSIIIEQLLESLRIYNIISRGTPKMQSRVTLTKDLFFKGDQFRPMYRQDYPNGEFIEVHRLDSLGWAYDFKYKFTEQLVNDTYYNVTFDDYPDVKIKCSPFFFKRVLFNCYINFISKNHRLTPCVLGMKALDVRDN